MSKTGIHWFRHGLRIHDNPALLACLDEVDRFIPIFIFDGKVAGTEICGFNRWRFLLQTLKDLETQFAKFGIHFMCFYGEPDEVLEQLIHDWDIKVISFEKDSEAIWRKRDEKVRELCQLEDVQVIESVSHTLYDPEDIFSITDGRMPNTQEKFKQACLRIGQPPKPLPRPEFDFIAKNLVSNKSLYDAKLHKVPGLDRFGIKRKYEEQKKCIFVGGETKALELFEKRLVFETENFRNGHQNQNITRPVLFTDEISLSPYLRFGCLSVRNFYWGVKKAFLKHYSGPKEKFHPAEQLFWREFFYQLSYKNENFARIESNPMSFKIPWNYTENRLFDKLENGKTGFPWIDACVRQLAKEGWVHNVGRNSIAIFLTRGDLFMSWEKGMQMFFRHLIDADWSVNAGNWNWISAGDPREVTDINGSFCPTKHSKKLDPEGIYIKKYVDELKDFPVEFIHEPCKAPHDVQERARCIIGKDYPEPIVDHDQVYKENLAKLRQFFQSEKKDIFETFINDQTVLKPTNTAEYKTFTYQSFLESEFEDF